MRRFRDPATLTAALFAGSAAISTVSGAAGAASQADQFSEQIAVNRLQRDREIEDLRRSDNAKLSRQRAMIAATGGDLSFGSNANVLETSEALAAKGQERLLQDFDFQRNVLKANKSTAKRQIGSKLFFGAANTAVAGALGFQTGGGDLKAAATSFLGTGP